MGAGSPSSAGFDGEDAIKRGDLSAVNEWLPEGTSASCKYNLPIRLAAFFGYNDIVKRLLKCGNLNPADVNHQAIINA